MSPYPTMARRARTVLKVDAMLCALVGVVFIAGARPLAELVDALSHGRATTVVRAIGVFLVVLAVDLALASTLGAKHLPTALAVFGAANTAWVVATVVVVAAGWLSTLGAVLALASGAIVAAFAFEELRSAGALRGTAPASHVRLL